MDVLLLSRIQFALTISFHYIFPPLSIGLGLILVIMEGMYLKTKKPVYLDMAKFWSKVFGLTFAIGVATGIVMEFEFGTNWATYSRFVGDIFGSALAAEGIFAFFLESGFLAVVLFGWNRVRPGFHYFSTIMVCLGAHFSAVWIVIANSWQQTPAGYHIVGEGTQVRAEITSFWEMVFNPSSMERLSHVLMGCWQAGAFLVISISAFYLLKKRHVEFAKASMKIGLIVAFIALLGQLESGHKSAKGVGEHQPAKLAAFEGLYKTQSEAPLYLFGWVDEKTEKVKWGVPIPGMLSFLAHGNLGATVTGLEAFKPEDRPPINFVFQVYHIMIVIGVALFGLVIISFFLLWRKKLFENRLWLVLLVISVMGPQIANQAGWFAAEVGRQPWIVYGLLRTSEGLSAVVKANAVLSSLILFTMIYTLLLSLFLFLLNQKIQNGPEKVVIKNRGRRA